MTQPTIENAIGALNELFSDVDMNKHRDAYETVRAVLETNTLPLDEVPEGWRFVEMRRSYTFPDGFNVRISNDDSDLFGMAATPAEALRAAIAKVTP